MELCDFQAHQGYIARPPSQDSIKCVHTHIPKSNYSDKYLDVIKTIPKDNKILYLCFLGWWQEEDSLCELEPNYFLIYYKN